MEAVKKSTPGIRIEPVYFDSAGCLRYARKYTLEKLGIKFFDLPDDIVDYYEGDIFFCKSIVGTSAQNLSRLQMKYTGVSVKPIDEVIRYLSSVST
jgi:hypothetical protein